MKIVLKTLFTINIFASVMILAILAVSYLLKGKVHNKIICFLWLLVLARLVIPITLESPVHLDALFPQTQAVEKPPVIEANTSKPVSMDSTPITTTDDSEVTYTPPIKPHIDTLDNNNEPVPYVEPSPPSRLEQVLSAIKRVDIWTYVLIAWAIGVVTLFARAMVEYLRFKRRVKLGRQIKDLIVTNIATECKAALGLDKDVRIITSRYVRTPVTFGFVLPIVLLPIGISHKLGEHKLRMVIIHELCHIKRKDIFINYLWLIAKMISWFNPLVYIAYKQHLHAIEIACDEMVLKNISMDDSFDYSESLLDVLRISRSQKVVPVTLSFCQDKTKIRKRVENMITPQRKLKSAGFISILLAVVMIVGCFTTACQPAEANNIKPSPPETNAQDDTLEKMNDSDIEKVETPIPEPTPEKIEPIYKATDHVNKVLSPENEVLSVTIDAEVEVPVTTSFPILKLEPKMLTQERVDAFLDTFFPERKAIATSEIVQIPTKAEIEEWIETTQQWIDTTEENTDGHGSTNHKRWQQEIDFFKEQLKEAPDKNPSIPAYDITKFSIIPLMTVTRDAELTLKELKQRHEKAIARCENENTELIQHDFTTKDARYSIYALHSNDPHINWFNVSNIDKHYFAHSYEAYKENYSDISGLDTTYDEAKQMAEKAVNTLGVDYMTLDNATIAPEYTFKQIEIGKHEMEIVGNSYRFVYSRNVNGANVTYTPSIVQYSKDYTTWAYEYFEIFIDDDGITRLGWNSCPTAISEIISENKTLLPFDDILNKATNIFEEQPDNINHSMNSRGANQYIEENRATIHENNIIIDKVVLGYIMTKENYTDRDYKLIPVWDFIGRESIHMDVKHASENYSIEDKTDMPENGDQHSFLTINAIDGSIIDRRKGK